ncbi:MAG: hypothetical protein OEV81_00145 [Betaproteobacteria bacterium]|nr:hypothetical protein [Betaproteobacteria bacterium]MDH5220630.1 hypothetical protein [Betaproteobacteria bacterium]MDH5350548.1 hypothetical protein [Betaproteobacteria bacterium]
MLLFLSIAGAAAAADDVLHALRQHGQVSCRSEEPFFCENVHVRCAGRTAVQTFPFVLRATAGSVTLVTEAPEFQRQYENADLEWAGDGSYILLQPKGVQGYVKLLADGKYVFRHYLQQGVGVMSLGRCR